MPFHPDHRDALPAHGGELIIVRHGQSTANALGIAQGRADYPLSEKGGEQARLTARHLAALGGITAVWSSPLARAAQTAEAIASALGLPVAHHSGLVETDVGVLSGLSWAELGERHPAAMAAYEAAEASSPGHPRNRELIPGWEPIDALVARIWGAMLELVASHPGDRLVVVSHGGVINAFLTHLLVADAREARWSHPSTNCAISRVRFAPQGPQAACLVDDAHLQQAGVASGATVFDRPSEKLL